VTDKEICLATMRSPKRPSLFKQRDLARAIRSARAAGATKAHVEIGKDGVISMKVDLTESSNNGEGSANPWDEVLTDAANKERAS
jgi:hypothetical protein